MRKGMQGTCLAAVACGLIAVGLAVSLRVLWGEARSVGRPAASGHLPAAARGPLSAALGGDLRPYWLHVTAGGELVARNRAQGLVAGFTSEGVVMSAPGGSTRLSTIGVGRGSWLEPVAGRAPSVGRNRVAYRRGGGLTEWYANGPLGLEQGFTLHTRPPASVSGRNAPVAIQMRLGGSLRPSLTSGGRAVEFSAAGRVRLSYGGLRVTDARGRVLDAWLSLRGRRLSLLVDDTGARYPLRVDPFVQAGKLTASDGAFGDELGRSVAVSGSTLALGAPFAQVGSNAQQGAVYVFTKNAEGWTQTAKLTVGDGAAGDDLGISVAIDGSTIVAGAEGSNAGQGAAYVFTEPAGGWSDENDPAKLTASDGTSGDLLGNSVAIEGSTVVAGARNAGVVGSGPGAAYVFTEPADGWSNEQQAAKLTASDGAPGDEFGDDVSISGTTIVAGAPFWSGGQGAVYVFTKPSGGWSDETQAARLTTLDAGLDELGAAVAVSGSTVVAGAPGAQVGANADQGAAYVFSAPSGGWSDETQSALLTASDGAANDGMGGSPGSVAISGTTIVVGVSHKAVGSNNAQGAAYVFDEPAGGFENEAAELTASDGAAGDDFGWSVAVAAETIIVGAPNAQTPNFGQGAAYVFQSPAPVQQTLTVSKAGTGSGAVTSSPSGIDCGSNCSARFDSGTQVTLNATAAPGSTFAGWSSGGCTGTGPCTVTVDSDTPVTATFNLVPAGQRALTVARAGSGSGTVSSSPAGIECGQSCAADFSAGTAVTLSASAAADSTFDGWSGACSGMGSCQLTLNSNVAVTATFEKLKHTLTLRKTGPGTGSVISGPAGIYCGGTCSARFDYGTGVGLLAMPSAGSAFAGWSGAACAGVQICHLTLNADAVISARFVASPVNVSGQASTNGQSATESVSCHSEGRCLGQGGFCEAGTVLPDGGVCGDLRSAGAQSFAPDARALRKQPMIATGHFTIPAHKLRLIRLKLTPAGRRLVRAHHRLVLIERIIVSTRGKRTLVVKRIVLLYRPRRG